MLERLRRLLPPPAEALEPGRPDGWPAVEAALGTGLPSDFKAFTELYGSGKVDDFLYLFNPFTQGPDGNLLVERDRVLAGYRQTRARFPDRLAWPPFPEEGGVLPLGRTDNGDELYWVTQGQPGDWPVALLEARAALQELYPMPVTAFLAALAANQLTPASSPAPYSGVPATSSPPSPTRDAMPPGGWGERSGGGRLSPPLVEPDQHGHDRDRDRHHRDPQRDQDVGGQPEYAAVILGPDLLGGSSWSLGAGSGAHRGAEGAVWVGVPEVGMDRLLLRG